MFKGEVLTDIFYVVEQNVKIPCVSHIPYCIGAMVNTRDFHILFYNINIQEHLYDLKL